MNGSSVVLVVVVVDGSCLLGCWCSAYISDLTLGALPSGLSSGPKNTRWLHANIGFFALSVGWCDKI